MTGDTWVCDLRADWEPGSIFGLISVGPASEESVSTVPEVWDYVLYPVYGLLGKRPCSFWRRAGEVAAVLTCWAATGPLFPGPGHLCCPWAADVEIGSCLGTKHTIVAFNRGDSPLLPDFIRFPWTMFPAKFYPFFKKVLLNSYHLSPFSSLLP